MYVKCTLNGGVANVAYSLWHRQHASNTERRQGGGAKDIAAMAHRHHRVHTQLTRIESACLSGRTNMATSPMVDMESSHPLRLTPLTGIFNSYLTIVWHTPVPLIVHWYLVFIVWFISFYDYCFIL